MAIQFVKKVMFFYVKEMNHSYKDLMKDILLWKNVVLVVKIGNDHFSQFYNVHKIFCWSVQSTQISQIQERCRYLVSSQKLSTLDAFFIFKYFFWMNPAM